MSVRAFLNRCYEYMILQKPVTVIVVIAILTAISAFYSQRFELDASAESLVLENDDSLAYYRQIRKQYGSDDFLIIAYTPFDDLLSENSLAGLRALRDQVSALENVQSVVSILDVPIIYTTGLRLSDLDTGVQTLDAGEIDTATARREFLSNPLYKNSLVSGDGKTTAVQIIFRRDDNYFDLLNRRDALRDKATANLTPDEKIELERVTDEFKTYHRIFLQHQEQDIETIRAIMDGQRHRAEMFLGGLPMIVADMIEFIRHDLILFGSGALGFLILILSVFFGKPRWVLLPMLCCTITGISVIGFLGFNNWQVTVISSNFLSILLIINLSLTIHLIVRYRDLHGADPDKDHQVLIRETVVSMAQPCFYTIVTTVVAFASLIVSGIRPVIDFGWTMIVGLVIAFLISFAVFPTTLAMLRPTRPPGARDVTRKITLYLAHMVRASPGFILMGSLLLALAFGLGIPKLKVENRFIDNFKATTEIFQGMQVIDRKLGGTTPLDIVIDPGAEFFELVRELEQEQEDFDELFAEDASAETAPSYWLNPRMMGMMQTIHQYVESLPAVGKVLSIGTLMQIATELAGHQPDEVELALLKKRASTEISDNLIKPYLSDDANQARIAIRVIESDPSLNRQGLRDQISLFLIDELGLDDSQVHLTGMLILYNNMLQSLFRSQILTLGAVLVAIFLTFVVLFRSIKLAALGIIPNLASVILVLGMMGWLGVPLDMMTITIAAITIGIAVDDTIHYIHRFKRELVVDGDYEEAVSRCHGGIGKAIYYTSLAVIFGFSILALSNFIPTINFGLLTGFAMLVALLGNLLLLPAIILLTRPRIGRPSRFRISISVILYARPYGWHCLFRAVCISWRRMPALAEATARLI